MQLQSELLQEEKTERNRHLIQITEAASILLKLSDKITNGTTAISLAQNQIHSIVAEIDTVAKVIQYLLEPQNTMKINSCL